MYYDKRILHLLRDCLGKAFLGFLFINSFSLILYETLCLTIFLSIISKCFPLYVAIKDKS